MPIHTLPLNTLEWPTFQKFCTDLLQIESGTIEAREYLRSGSKQDGIDIYVTKQGTDKLTIAQCKKKEYISPTEIDDIVSLFLDGKFKSKAKEFIICTSFDFSAKENHENALDKIRTRLKENNIELRVWDLEGINTLLRENASDKYIALVYRYFRHELTSEFYGPVYIKYIERLNLPARRNYDFSISNYIPRSLYMTNHKHAGINLSLREFIRQKLNSSPTLIQLIVTASAGLGKSVEMRNIVNHIYSEHLEIFPIYADLRNYDGQELEVFLFGTDITHSNIPGERLFLLLDGMDEVSPNLFPTIVKKINSFIQRRPVHFLLSVRNNFIDLNNPPISGSTVCILEDLSKGNIISFVDQQLAEKSERFINELYKHNFFEYCYTPFYLINLVELYKSNIFPKNRNELLKYITLKNLHRDIEKYNNKEAITHIFAIGKRIAFLSSIIGKTAVSTSELKQFEINDENIELLGKLSIIEKHTSAFSDDKWSFRHKNIQEYLTAEILAHAAHMDAIRDIIFVEREGLKQVNQSMLNSLSFLVSSESISSNLFNSILQELLEHDPEVLLKFESDKLTKEIRSITFFKIWNKYKADDLSLYSSHKFNLQEFTAFFAIDRQKIEFLLHEIENGQNIGLIRNALVLLINDRHTPPTKTLIQTTLNNILYSSDTCGSIKGQILETLHGCKIISKLNITDYLNSNIDINDLNIREAFLIIIKADKISGYSQFLLESIEFFESSSIDIYDSTISYYIKDTLINLQTEDDLKALLKYLIENPNRINHFEETNRILFEYYELENLFENIQEVAKENKEVIILVYRLMIKLELIEFEPSIFKLFVSFFKKLNISHFIFEKSLKWKKSTHFSTPFLSLESLPLLEVLSIGSEQDRTTLSNILWNCYNQSESLFNLLKTNWKLDEHYQFPNYEKPLTQDEIKKMKDQERQALLLDRNLFIEQASEIFNCYGKDEIDDYFVLIKSGKVNRYLNSLTLAEIGRWSRKRYLTLNDFIQTYSDDKTWGDFKIKSIINMLKERNRITPIDNNLMLFAKEWCMQQINSEDFEEFFWEDENNSFTYSSNKLRVFDLYQMLRFEMTDEMYRKLLIYDIYPYRSSKSITQLIIQKTVDIEKLKEKIVSNLKRTKLPQNILLNHLHVGKELNIDNIIDIAYYELLNRKDLTPQSKIHLSRFYMELGGDLEDILNPEILKAEILKNESDLLFEWHLLDVAMLKEYRWANLFIDTLIDQISKYEIHVRSKLIKYLFIKKNHTAIKVWISESIIVGEDILSRNRDNSIIPYIENLPLRPTISSLVNGLKNICDNSDYENWDSFNSIYEAVIFNIKGLIEIRPEAFGHLNQELLRIKAEFSDNKNKRNIQNLILTFNYHYFNTIPNIYSIEDAKKIFTRISGVAI